MVKFSHTVFALPFALAATALAARGHGITLGQVVAILVAMAGARTAAMGFNRIVDRRLDARNPRTANRELPTGKVSVRGAAAAHRRERRRLRRAPRPAWGGFASCSRPVVLGLVLGYSFAKRFTWLCHLFLGLAIGIAPAGAWIAVRGDLGWPAVWLVAAVATWIGGFDILYALADRDFDRQRRDPFHPRALRRARGARHLRGAARRDRGRVARRRTRRRPGHHLLPRRGGGARHPRLRARHRPPDRISRGSTSPSSTSTATSRSSTSPRPSRRSSWVRSLIALAKPGSARRSQSAGGFRNPPRVPDQTVGTVGIEPTTNGLRVRCSTN